MISIYLSIYLSISFSLSHTDIYIYLILLISICPRGEMVKAMDCGIVVSEFELLSGYYYLFRTNPLLNPFIPPAMG